MAELKSTLVSGNLAAKKIYQNGTPLDEKFATTIALSGSTLQLKNAGGVVISSATIPAGEMSSSVSGGTVTTTVTKAGWFAKDTKSSETVASGTITNNTSGGTSSGTIALGAQIKIGKGYYANDVYYQAASASSGTAASGFSLSITDKSSTNITVGTKSGSYYPLTASLTGTFSASTAGYFSTGSATDSSVTVGRMAAAAFNVSENKVYCATAGYSPAGSANSAVATIATATPAFDGGGLSGGTATVTGTSVTLSDTNNGIYVTADPGTVTRAAVLYNGAVKGYVNVADNAEALPSTTLNPSATTKYISAISVPSGKTLSTVNGSGTVTTLGGSVKVGTYSSTGTITTMSGTKTITTHSGTTTVSSNTGTLNITKSTGTVKYSHWTITETGNDISFTYSS